MLAASRRCDQIQRCCRVHQQNKMPIRVALVGVGNCASALVQGVHKYREPEGLRDGLMSASIGGYRPGDISFAVAFDVDRRKVGRPLREAILAQPNCCWPVDTSVSTSGDSRFAGVVHQAPRLDGVSDHMLSAFQPLERDEPADVARFAKLLGDFQVDVLINYLPVGSQLATEFWAEVCLSAKVAMVNCIPVFIASDPAWSKRFEDAGVPIIGDDMKSQFGASILSQMLQELAFSRGHRVLCHVQQNSGGNTDFLNMTNQHRLASKKTSKENVIKSQHIIRGIDVDGPAGTFVHAGPSDYIQYYGDTKIAHFHLELEGFGGAPVALDARLKVEDSPNSAGVVIDAVRYLQVAREMGISGALKGASAFTQKSPPVQMTMDAAMHECAAMAGRAFTPHTSRGDATPAPSADQVPV